MKCPACFNELKPLQVGSVTVDVCQGGCGGVWFDAFELQRIEQEDETATQWLMNVERDPQIQLDPLRKRKCPRCTDVKLMRHFHSPKRRVEVDECPGCGGFWLDAGELARIRAELQAQRELAQGQQPYLTSRVIRYLYQVGREKEDEN
jgi:hypothetical protein